MLPLAKDRAKSVAVIGPLADAKRDLLTMWSGFDVDPSSTVSVVEGVRNKLGARARVEYAPGVQLQKTYVSMFDTLLGGKMPAPWTQTQAREEFAKALDVVKRSDVVILVLG